jgi:RNA polymerase sigma factor for flagellar operon FliA
VGNVTDSQEVLDRFESQLGLVEVLARQVGRALGQGVSLDELVSYGREGLLDAARRFEPARGVPFRSYANYRVRGAIVDGVRASASVPRRAYQRISGYQAALRVSEGASEDIQTPLPLGFERAQAEQALGDHLAAMATALAVGLLAGTARGEEGELTTVSPSEDPEEALARAELSAAIRMAVADLPHPECVLVQRHYLDGERFDVVAQELGLSKSWASRLHTRAIGRLSKRLRGLSV